MTITTLANVELEPRDFHPDTGGTAGNRGLAGFSVRLSFELDYLSEDDAEEKAQQVYRELLRYLDKTRFQPYLFYGNELFILPHVSAFSVFNAFDQTIAERFHDWLQDKAKDRANDTPPRNRFFNTTHSEEELSEADAVAAHLTQGAGTWIGPLPQTIGLTFVVTYKWTDVLRDFIETLLDKAVGLRSGYVDKLIDELKSRLLQTWVGIPENHDWNPFLECMRNVLEDALTRLLDDTQLEELIENCLEDAPPPWLKPAVIESAEIALLNWLAILPMLRDGHPNNSYPVDPSGQDPTELLTGPIAFDFPAETTHEHCVRTTTVKSFDFDPSSLVDFDTGFLRPQPQAEELQRALRRFEDRSSSMLWALPACLAADFTATARVIGTVPGLAGAHSFPVGNGLTITVGDGATTATINSNGAVTVQEILDTVNHAAGNTVGASLTTSDRRLRFEARGPRPIVVDGTASAEELRQFGLVAGTTGPIRGGEPDKEPSDLLLQLTAKRLVWQAVTGLTATIDPIVIALTLPGMKSQGPLLGPLVQFVTQELQAEAAPEKVKRLSEAPHRVAGALQTAINAQTILSADNASDDSRRAYVEALIRILDLSFREITPDSKLPPSILGTLLSLFIAHEGEQVPINKAKALHEDFGPHSRSEASLTQKLVAELQDVATRLQDENGIEAALVNLLSPPEADSFVAPFGQAFSSDDGLNEEELKFVKSACAQGLQSYLRELAQRFDGADAARHAGGAVYQRHLSSEALREIAASNIAAANQANAASFVTFLQDQLRQSTFLHRRLSVVGDGGMFVDVLAQLHKLGVAELDADGMELIRSSPGGDLDVLWELMVMDLLPDQSITRFVPDHAPSALPVQIAVDQNIHDLDEFANQFNGVSLLIKRTLTNGGGMGDTSWAFANLATVKLLEFDSHDEGIAQPCVFPLQPVEADGRRILFISYDGTPFAAGTYADTMPDGNSSEGTKLLAFHAIEEFKSYGTSSFERVPALTYGARYEFVGHVVSKGGILPPALCADPPWTPRPDPDSAAFDHYVQTFGCSRRTAIGRTMIAEKSGAPHRIGTVLAGVEPLYEDYPRLGLSATDTGALIDVLRNTDGTGAMDLPERDGEVHSVTVADLVLWGATATLSLGVFADPRVDVASPALALISAPFADQPWGDLIVNIERRRTDGSGQVIYAASAFRRPFPLSPLVQIGVDVEFPHDGITPLWLRLGIRTDNAATLASLSFADPTKDVGGTSGSSKPIPQTLLIIAPDKPDIWIEPARKTVDARVVFPRVGYLDLERWLNNPRLREAARGDMTPAEMENVCHGLLTWYIGRLGDEQDVILPDPNLDLADALERLPDLAVHGLLFELTPLDAIDASPASASPRKGMAGVWKLPALGTVLNQLDQNQWLERLAEKYSARLTIEGKGTELNLNVALQDGKVSVQVPEGMVARLTVRPLVDAAHFQAGPEPLAVIEPRLRELAVGTHRLDGKSYLVFDGASLVIECMLGPFVADEGMTTLDWQAEFSSERNEWAELVALAIDDQPAGAARAYDLVINGEPIVAQANGWKWRQLGSVDVATQRWRFTGRPIYSWFDPSAGQPVTHPALRVTFLAQEDALTAFEEEAFFDRDDLDAQEQTSRLRPLPEASIIHHEEWEKPSATYYRHRVTVRSRYAGAFNATVRATVKAWGTDQRSPDPVPEAWIRMVMLADRTSVQVARPQLRALVPLTAGVDVADAQPQGAPPVLALLQERPFDYGGLADRVVAEIQTGFGYSVEMVLPQADREVGPREESEEAGSTALEPRAIPIDSRKEIGPDPRMTYRSFDAETALGIALLNEGPVGLTYDRASAPAPAFPNSMMILHPTSVRQPQGQRVPAEFEEHFLSVTVRRYLDPRWLAPETVSALRPASAEPKSELRTSDDIALDATVPSWIKATNGTVVNFGALTVCRVRFDSDEWVVDVNPRAFDPSARDVWSPSVSLREMGTEDTAERSSIAGYTEQPLTICKANRRQIGSLALLHVPLEPGRYELAVFGEPVADAGTSMRAQRFDGQQKHAPSASADRLAGRGSLPIVLASFKWSTGKSPLAANVTVSGLHAPVLTNASPTTFMNWTRTNKNFDTLWLGSGEPIHVKDVRTRQDSSALMFLRKESDTGVEDQLWIRPRLDEKCPLHVQRHLGAILTRRALGLGRMVEVFQKAIRLIGKTLVLPNAEQSDYIRVLEFETPAAILGYPDNLLPRAYRSAYFDFAAIAPQINGHLSLYCRLVASPRTKQTLKSVGFALAIHNERSVEQHIEVNIPDLKSNSVSAMVFSFTPGAAPTCVLLLESGDRTDAQIVVSAVEDLSNASGMTLRVITAVPEVELWFDVSMLTHSPGKVTHEDFDFDWLFTGTDAEVDLALAPEGLNTMREAQARFVSVSPPIPIEAVGPRRRSSKLH